jgi:predicted O-linked N-acetylglucosamine transferase (SPINDLY family)
MRLAMSRYEAETMIDGGRWQMSKVQFKRIWIEQCQAARRVKEHFGLADALDYLIGEKLLTFAEVAEQRAEFMQELPDFLQEICAVFTLEETSEYATQIECSRPLSPVQRNTLRAISSASAHVH